MTTEDSASDCVHIWEVWAWLDEYLKTERTYIYICATCRRCGTVSEGMAPLGSRVGAVLPGVGALEAEAAQDRVPS